MKKIIVSYIIPAFLIISVLVLAYVYIEMKQELKDKENYLNREYNINDDGVCDVDICTPELKPVILENLLEGEKISSPLRLKGVAKSNWFFEGDFPVLLTNWDGFIIAETYVSATDEIVEGDYDSFEGVLEFETVTTDSDSGSLIFQKDNPTGLAENDEVYEIKVLFE